MVLIHYSEDRREHQLQHQHLCPFASNCSLHSLSCDGSALCSSCTHGTPYLVFGLKCRLKYAIACDPSRVSWQWEILESHWWSPCPDSQNCQGIRFQNSEVCIYSHLFWIYIYPQLHVELSTRSSRPIELLSVQMMTMSLGMSFLMSCNRESMLWLLELHRS